MHPKPPVCPLHIYENIIAKCFLVEDERPDFQKLCEIINDIDKLVPINIVVNFEEELTEGEGFSKPEKEEEEAETSEDEDEEEEEEEESRNPYMTISEQQQQSPDTYMTSEAAAKAEAEAEEPEPLATAKEGVISKNSGGGDFYSSVRRQSHYVPNVTNPQLSRRKSILGTRQ